MTTDQGTIGGNQLSDRNTEDTKAFTLKMRSLDALIFCWSVEIVEIEKTNSFVEKQRTVKFWNLRMAFHLDEFVF